MKTANPYLILLYYCFTPIRQAEAFREAHHRLCLSLNLRGRIIVAEEGINGTVSGLAEDCQRYIQLLREDPRFKDTDFKVVESPQHVFNKLNVRLKKEIVHAGLPHIKPFLGTGAHLSPLDFKQLKDSEDVVILDVRSKYEHQLGKFRNAVTLDIAHFREFPDKIEELQQYKDKKIITYCTGGIKCEKASAWLLEQGFENVYQLHGGIIKYGLETDGEDFEGSCYVFDSRIVVPVNESNPSMIARCHICQTPSEHMVNCANTSCNKHTVICESCMKKMEGCCSTSCQQSPDKRPYNTEGYYPRQQNGYNPYRRLKR